MQSSVGGFTVSQMIGAGGFSAVYRPWFPLRKKIITGHGEIKLQPAEIVCR
jgi:hypothetical protein